MDRSRALGWEPPSSWRLAEVIDSHTGGEPFRIVLDGIPDIPGETMLERRRWASENLDDLRRALMWEPRGHRDMYGGWVLPPLLPDSDIAVLFTHNAGFSTMCGHGIIALAKVALETGLVPVAAEQAEVAIDTPAGQVRSRSRIADGRVVRTSFVNVASFVSALDATVAVEGIGQVPFDIAYGGAFYAYVDGDALGLDMTDAPGLVDVAGRIKQAVTASHPIEHPDGPDLGFLYGVIFTSEVEEATVFDRHVCVFADGEVDRSPTGTGVSGRLAILYARGRIEKEEVIEIESIVGSRFSGRIVGETTVAGTPAILPEVSGSAHVVGRSQLWLDPEDPLGGGFLL